MSLLSQNQGLKGVLPADFAHGYASASYQIEGGHDRGGRGPSIWDEALKDQENGNDAVNSFELWEQDVTLLKQYGCKAYRFSISWSRVKPLGGKDDPVNEEGIEYYNQLIDSLLKHDIIPYVTLFHWDLPLALQQRYNGFRCENKEDIVADFVSYADLLFRRFGDRVNNWITLNEPWVFVLLDAVVINTKFDPETDPWTVAHRQILVHAYAVDLYRRHYQAKQNGKIGITLNIDWTVPIDDSKEAQNAAELAIAMALGWFADPIFKGENSKILRSRYADQILDFTPEEWLLIKGSSDFFGLNHYGTKWATGKVTEKGQVSGFQFFGAGVEQVAEKNGQLIGTRGHNGHPHTGASGFQSDGLYHSRLSNHLAVPWGFRQLLNHVWQRYASPNGLGIIVTENGFAIENEHELSLEKIIDDKQRQEYFDLYLTELCEAVQEGVQIDGYMGWSLLDNLEWSHGYKPRFGVTYVDRDSKDFKRYPKNSTKVVQAIWKHVVKASSTQKDAEKALLIRTSP